MIPNLQLRDLLYLVRARSPTCRAHSYPSLLFLSGLLDVLGVGRL